MTAGRPPRVFSIPTGAPFLPVLAEATLSGALVPGFAWDGDPLTLADMTIFVPTRRAARELRSTFAERLASSSCRRGAILPVIRPLGEFDEDDSALDLADPAETELAPPIAPLERLLRLAPLVRAWKSRLPAHITALFDEQVVVPASAADSIWLARDLAALIDEIETEGADWKKLGELVSGSLAGWWQVTLDFLDIVTSIWPEALKELDRSNPAAHRDALIRREAKRLAGAPAHGPVIAAGSTGSIPATAELLATISRLPNGAVVLPGLDLALDDRSWRVLDGVAPHPSVFGHPQFGLARLLRAIGIARADVAEIGALHAPLRIRGSILSEALKPAETTDDWMRSRARTDEAAFGSALAGIALIEAANEREEAAAIAVALRGAIVEPGRTAALVTTDRELARRVSAELQRFGIRADDSGGRPLADTPAAELLKLVLEAVFEPGNPVPIAGLLKHPFLRLGFERAKVRHAAETIELFALRGGAGRPDIADLQHLFDDRLKAFRSATRKPFWFGRIDLVSVADARAVLNRLAEALAPLAACRGGPEIQLAELARITIIALERLARDEAGGFAELYQREQGEKFAGFFRALVSSNANFPVAGQDWPDVAAALIASEVVKPAAGSDGRVSIWGALEARLQTVDMLVVGGLNEGSWPRKAEPDRFMSRVMKGGLELDPPERRIGLAAHDFMMAMGHEQIVLTRSARSGDAPATASRWLQRLATFAGPDETARMHARGDEIIAWARSLDAGAAVKFEPRPKPKPPLGARPKRFSVTEIETLRRDPYAIYARHVLRLSPLDPLLRDPGAAERGTLFHLILSRFTESCPDPAAPDAETLLVAAARSAFAEACLPPDVEAVWWPRFEGSVEAIIAWERRERAAVKRRLAEVRSDPLPVGGTGVTLLGYADRIDLLAAGRADVLDFKTGSSPSKAQAHTLIAPQLALEGALLMRGAFKAAGPLLPHELAHVRLKANGEVEEESILKHRNSTREAKELSELAWNRLEDLLHYYADPRQGYLSRALPFREGEVEGDYDHLARVLEWSAGGDGEAEGSE
ncbi:double-strand break repair protein AddB [Mesorhizobium sp. BAC0120]|uniref:double-strand break repair protein AddB n=1 Tax=Mesorhizobium sp. BAC0120 TaxID=3090670 RepID=UPI00298BE814|nr:double-strand break repair protein AddB [Mesorhizobium sp. BAC0120]MDW6024527.1 double-strand break repair protein AddB [Mesorhizobium sp. BAC0120]